MVLNYKDYGGNGGVIVLLHGMAGSLRYWDNFSPYISKGHRLIAIDLLGFGHSPMPKNVTYDYPTHMESIRQTLDHIGITEPFILVGHSMGGLIALRYAAEHPAAVSRLVVIGMPIYGSPRAARYGITHGSKLKELAYYGNTSRLLCTLWCRFLRPLSSRLAPFYLPGLSRDSARDSVLHTWQSYAQSLHYILESQTVGRDLANLTIPVVMIYGDRDIPEALVGAVADHKHVKIYIFHGTHQIIYEQPQKIASLIVG